MFYGNGSKVRRVKSLDTELDLCRVYTLSFSDLVHFSLFATMLGREACRVAMNNISRFGNRIFKLKGTRLQNKSNQENVCSYRVNQTCTFS